MEKIVVNAQVRSEIGKRNAMALRKAGSLPAIMYNSKGESTIIEVNEVEFTKVWKMATPTTLITLHVDGKNYLAFIKDTQYDILSETNLHVDFQIIDEDAVLARSIVIQTTGNPVGVRDGGVVEYGIKSVKIACLPKDLPVRMVVDISELALDQQICVKDVPFGSKVKVITSGDGVIAQIRKAK